MSRSVQGGRNDRQNVRLAQVHSKQRYRGRSVLATRRRGHPAPRLIGFSIATSVPKLTGIRWRFCTRWDEEPAAVLGKSLLQLGICRPADWSGSAVDFVERGFQRFCNEHGNQKVKKVFVGDLRVMDCIFGLSPRERDEAETDAEESKTMLYLVGDYEAAASIPIGATLPYLEREHELLPAAFYEVFTTNLWKWMRVYDYAAAKEHADRWTDGLSEEEINESVYAKVESELPTCIGRHRARFNGKKALRFLQQIYPGLRSSIARSLVKHVLEMDVRGREFTHAWPENISQKEIPRIREWLVDAEDCRPGCLITWYEDDAINACFDEEAQHMGENGPCQPNVLLGINLNKPTNKLERRVRQVFGHAAAMLESLASAAKIVEMIREIYDEYLREHRLNSGFPVEPSPAGLRQE
jgi:hypothetical protein